eukprot:GHVN01092251.1.p1 GENE.GHVN01092251.1~~GHVN01092251.1.p1  ORF type:complete len:676 (-),score=183.03 GHVN01092251.1:536-2563(-)
MMSSYAERDAHFTHAVCAASRVPHPLAQLAATAVVPQLSSSLGGGLASMSRILEDNVTVSSAQLSGVDEAKSRKLQSYLPTSVPSGTVRIYRWVELGVLRVGGEVSRQCGAGDEVTTKERVVRQSVSMRCVEKGMVIEVSVGVENDDTGSHVVDRVNNEEFADRWAKAIAEALRLPSSNSLRVHPPHVEAYSMPSSTTTTPPPGVPWVTSGWQQQYLPTSMDAVAVVFDVTVIDDQVDLTVMEAVDALMFQLKGNSHDGYGGLSFTNLNALLTQVYSFTPNPHKFGARLSVLYNPSILRPPSPHSLELLSPQEFNPHLAELCSVEWGDRTRVSMGDRLRRWDPSSSASLHGASFAAEESTGYTGEVSQLSEGKGDGEGEKWPFDRVGETRRGDRGDGVSQRGRGSGFNPYWRQREDELVVQEGLKVLNKGDVFYPPVPERLKTSPTKVHRMQSVDLTKQPTHSPHLHHTQMAAQGYGWNGQNPYPPQVNEVAVGPHQHQSTPVPHFPSGGPTPHRDFQPYQQSHPQNQPPIQQQQTNRHSQHQSRSPASPHPYTHPTELPRSPQPLYTSPRPSDYNNRNGLPHTPPHDPPQHTHHPGTPLPQLLYPPRSHPPQPQPSPHTRHPPHSPRHQPHSHPQHPHLRNQRSLSSSPSLRLTRTLSTIPTIPVGGLQAARSK